MTCDYANFVVCLESYWDSFMPAPHSILLKGLTIGLDDLSKVPMFKQALINTGTIHVAVVSGYNISLVVNTAKFMVGNRVSRVHTMTYIVMSLAYSIFTGFEAPIVRAWLMSTICLATKFTGRAVTGVNILIVTCLVMVLHDNTLLTSYSFILSSGATLGLLVYGNTIQILMYKYVKVPINVLREDLGASLAASIIVSPFIAYSFSRISFYSPLINMLLLWTVPYATLIGFGCVIITLIDILIGTEFCKYLFLFAYPFLDVFIKGINYFGQFKFISTEVTVYKWQIITYYVLLVIVTLFIKSLIRGRQNDVQK